MNDEETQLAEVRSEALKSLQRIQDFDVGSLPRSTELGKAFTSRAPSSLQKSS